MQPRSLLRKRGEGIASVSFTELLLDLIYVFAVTQISHYLLHNLSWLSFVQSTVLWFSIWLGWQHTTWMTNWFDPNVRSVRIVLFALMIVGLVLAAALPRAFGDKGIVYAVCYVVMQVGRSLSILFMLGKRHPLTPNYKRILGWFIIAAVFWILGAFQESYVRLALWTVAVLCDYLSPMFGFYLPFLGRSDTGKEWTIDGHHLTERSQLFVIIAFGETILITGASLSTVDSWSTSIVLASIVSVLSSLSMWWIYFDTSSEAGSERIQKEKNPGLLGLKYHSIHVVLIGAIIMSAVGDELVVSDPLGHLTPEVIFAIIGGSVIYLAANIIYKRFACRTVVRSHIAGILALLLIVPFCHYLNLLLINAFTVFVFVLIGIYELASPKRSCFH